MWGAAIAALGNATAAIFNWFSKKEEGKTVQQKRDEVQQIRTERENEIQYNEDAVKYGVDPITGRVLYPAEDK